MVVSVEVEGENSECFLQIKEFYVDKRTGEQLITGRWLYTKRDAMDGMIGRPGPKETCDNLFITDYHGTISAEAVNEKVSAKSPWLFRAGLDDKRVKAHFNDDTKVITELKADIVAELKYYKSICDPNMLNEFGDQFSTDTNAEIRRIFCSRLARRSHSAIGKDLVIDFGWYHLLAFEFETLDKASLEYFQIRENRRKVWRRIVTLRLTAEEWEPELGDKWYILPTQKDDPEGCDRIELGGTILLKWDPSNPFTAKLVVESASRNSVAEGVAPFWERTVPHAAAVVQDPMVAVGPSSDEASGLVDEDSEEYSDSDDVPLISFLQPRSPAPVHRPAGSGAAEDDDDEEEYSDDDMLPLPAFARSAALPALPRPNSASSGETQTTGGLVVAANDRRSKRRCVSAATGSASF